MKHIEKKFLFEDNIKDLTNHNHQQIPLTELNNDLLKKSSKDNYVIIETSKDKKILAFIHNNNGKHITVPVPDFTLVYYDFAYKLNISRKESIKTLFNQLSDINKFSEVNSNLVYEFYGYSTSCIVNLFTAIESFINSLLPSDIPYIKNLTNKTEIYTREQIQSQIQFLDKLKEVLPQFYGKNFFTHPTATNNHIYKLKELRDKIIHTKSDGTAKSQIELFKLLLNFKYEETLDAVRKLINFYKENYIVDCPCEGDF